MKRSLLYFLIINSIIFFSCFRSSYKVLSEEQQKPVEKIEEAVLSYCDNISDWNYGVASGSYLYMELDSDSAHTNNNSSIKASYDIKNGKWMYCNITTPYKLIESFVTIQTLSFYLKGDGGNNEIKVGLKDSESEMFESKVSFPLYDKRWKQYKLNIDDFQSAYYQPSGSKLRNRGKIDLQRVQEFFVSVEGVQDKSKSGIFNLDDITFKFVKTEKKELKSIVKGEATNYFAEINPGGQSDQQYAPYSYGYLGRGWSDYKKGMKIFGTDDEEKFKSERVGKEFSYLFDCPNGSYQVELCFAEYYWRKENSRVFNVYIENKMVISNLDLVADYGKDIAVCFIYNTVVRDGQLDVHFKAIKDNAKISAIKVGGKIKPTPIVKLEKNAGEKLKQKSLYKDVLSISQTGYKPNDKKEAVVSVEKDLKTNIFNVYNKKGDLVLTGELKKCGDVWDRRFYIADFSSIVKEGIYYLTSNKMESYLFPINESVYQNIKSRDADISIDNIFTGFFAQQRCYDEKCVTPGIYNPKKNPGLMKHFISDKELPAFIVDGTGKNIHNGKPVKGKVIKNLTGGWHDAFSTDKETVKEAGCALDLMWAYEENPSIFSKGKGLPKILEEVKWGLDYLMRIQDKDGGFYLAVKPHDFWDSNSPHRRVLINKGTGVTARASACFAAAYRIFKKFDTDYAKQCLKTAEKGWNFVKTNHDKYITARVYPTYWIGKSSDLILTGVEFYLSLKDENTRQADNYKSIVTNMIKQGKITNGVWVKRDGRFTVQSGDEIGTVLEEQIIVALCKIYPYVDEPLRNKIKSDIENFRNFWLKVGKKNPYGAEEDFFKPYFGMCGWLTHLIKQMLYIGKTFKDKEAVEYAKNQFRWMTGNNPFNTSYIVGFGERFDKELGGRTVEQSIGGVVPGILDENEDGIPEIMYGIFDPGINWKTQECCLDYSGALLLDLALLDQFE